ncbi:MAG: TolC family protein [Planctomycetes bacterium]|nr:TolC family protein [Planctomycetota bacterium]
MPSHWALLCLISMILGLGGCSLWRGDLDPEFERRVDKRLQNFSTTHLETRSAGGPTTVEQGLAAIKKQRPAATTPATAPAALDLRIDRVRRYVLENNLDLRIYTLEPDIAKTKISEEEAKFDATITVAASYKKKNLPPRDGDIVQLDEKGTALSKSIKAFESGLLDGEKKSDKGGLDNAFVALSDIEQQKEEIGLDAGILVPLPTGAKMQFGQSFGKFNKLSPFPSDQSTSYTGFSLSQPLLRNAGTDANLASIRIARLNTKATTANTRLIAIRLLAAAEKSYWMLYGARRQLEIRQRLNELAQKNLNIVRQRADEGLVATIEVTRAEVGVALQLESLVVAETYERMKERELKRILNIEGVDLNSPTRLSTSTPPSLLSYRLDAEALVQDALANRMEMLELEMALAADNIRIDFAKNQALPMISLDFQYGVVDRAGSFGTSFQGAWDFDNTEFGVGIKGEIPVTNQLREAQLRRAVLTRTQRLATRAARELMIRQEVFDNLDLLNQNWQRILTARQSAIVSGINYEAELKQFDEGFRTMREVFEALAQLGDAQSREINAIVAYQISLIDLAFATGTLMGYAKVDFDGSFN